MQFAHDPMVGNDPQSSQINEFISEARERLQSLGIADVPDEVLANVVREVKKVKEVPEKDEDILDAPDKDDYTLPQKMPVSIPLSFDEERGLFRPPQTPPRSTQKQFEYIVPSPSDVHRYQFSRNNEVEDDVATASGDDEVEFNDMSAQSSIPIDLTDDVGDNIAMSLLSPRPAVAKTNNSAFETFHSPGNGGIFGDDDDVDLEYKEMIERKMSATANTPSSSTFYRSNVGPYQYKDIHTEASRKAMLRHRRKKLERGKSAQATKTVGGKKNAQKKNKKRNILKSGAKRVPVARKSIDITRSRAKNTQARKKNAKSPPNLTPKSQRERQRYIHVKNRRLLTSVLQSSPSTPNKYRNDDDTCSIDTNLSTVVNHSQSEDYAKPGTLRRSPIDANATTPMSRREKTPRKSDPVKMFRNHQSVWQSLATPRQSSSPNIARRPHTASKLEGNSRGLRRSTVKKRVKKHDPVSMFASHQKHWKKKTLKNIGNNRHDRTRMEIRAKMLRTRLLNEDAGKRGFGRPSRSVDKWS